MGNVECTFLCLVSFSQHYIEFIHDFIFVFLSCGFIQSINIYWASTVYQALCKALGTQGQRIRQGPCSPRTDVGGLSSDLENKYWGFKSHGFPGQQLRFVSTGSSKVSICSECHRYGPAKVCCSGFLHLYLQNLPASFIYLLYER